MAQETQTRTFIYYTFLGRYTRKEVATAVRPHDNKKTRRNKKRMTFLKTRGNQNINKIKLKKYIR